MSCNKSIILWREQEKRGNSKKKRHLFSVNNFDIKKGGKQEETKQFERNECELLFGGKSKNLQLTESFYKSISLINALNSNIWCSHDKDNQCSLKEKKKLPKKN